jgi:16S rRNA (adenine1518-N6/adenine1519-N6)-dimethyltransferase
VVSGVIRLTRREEPLNVKSERAYWVLVKTAFNQRRKTLRNALKSQFTAEVMADEIFNKRAEQLSIEEFANLTYLMK